MLLNTRIIIKILSLVCSLLCVTVNASNEIPRNIQAQLDNLEQMMHQSNGKVPLVDVKTRLQAFQQQLQTCQRHSEQELATLNQLNGTERKAVPNEKIDINSLRDKGILKNESYYSNQLIACKYYLIKVAQLNDKYIAILSHQRITDYWHRNAVYHNSVVPKSQITNEQLIAFFSFYSIYFILLLVGLMLLKRITYLNRQAEYQACFSTLFIVAASMLTLLVHQFINILAFDSMWLLFSSVILLPLCATQRNNFIHKVVLAIVLAIGMSNTLLIQTDIIWQVDKYWHGFIAISAIVSAAMLFYLSQFKIGRRSFVAIAVVISLLEVSEFHTLAHQMIVVLYLLLMIHSLHYAVLLFIDSAMGMIKLAQPIAVKQMRGMLKTSTKIIPGMKWFKWSVYFSIIIYSIMLLLSYSGLPDNMIVAIDKMFTDGVHVGTVAINPKNILLAMFVLSNLLIVSWLVRQKMEQKYHKRDTEATNRQNAMAALFWYSAVSFSVLTALSISGFSVQNLALIAGAFSVGIGFGLQNIVSNFVSGIILLIERPVKPNDWIDIGGTQGIVQKINIRATHVKTFDNSDILIPNSELISNQVRNFMFDDRIGRVILHVGVAYGSDTRLVQKLLLQVMNENPLVIKDDENYNMSVIFKEFGDSSLNFQLKCFIDDILGIYEAQSEINFAIDDILRANKIEIPFPQRDVHMR